MMANLVKKAMLALSAAVMAVVAQAQPGMGMVQVSSPIVNADNTVTFNYRNDRAKEVKINAQFAPEQTMTKNAQGVWSITLGPVAPDMYPYCFVVDGLNVMDPLNPDWFPNETFKNSIVDVRGNEPLIHSVQDVPHGSVDYLQYYSKTLGTFANAIVYTPPFYDENKDKKYPIYYLISGTTDTEEVFFKVGRVNFILDNLIAKGEAKDMIVVLPYGNPSKYFQPGESHGMANFNGDVLNDLMPFIESKYRTINDAAHRAIGGFSRGGNQGLAIGLGNLDKFSYLCSYSSFTSTTIQGVFDDAKTTNSKINLFWLGVGTDDFLYGNAKDFMDFLDNKGIDNIKFFTTDKFGHTWMNAKCFLGESLPLLFQDKAKIDVYAKKALADIPESVKNSPKAAQSAGGFSMGGRPQSTPQETPQGQGAQSASVLPQQGSGEQRLTPQVMSRLFPAGVNSPEYNKDGSVTFRFQAPNAQKVELECQALSANMVMSKDDRGVWSATITSIKPDIYPYCFVVDGTQIADPNNMFIFPNEGFKYSLADVRGVEPSVQDLQDVAHGKISYRFYHSKNVGFDRPMCVYTPAGYDPTGKEKLPVLYLIHGMTDTYETWFKVGRINNIMDNLIAQGKVKRMIIVMPYANPYPEMITRGLAKSADVMGTDMFCREMLGDVIPFIEQNYNVKTDADSRAIAGFSLGGRQTLACGFGNPDKFHWVCAFAPAIFGNEYDTNFENGTYASVDKLKSSLKLMWLGTGTEDFLKSASDGLDKSLTQRGLKHTSYFPSGGHTWMNCRDYITRVAQLLFK